MTDGVAPDIGIGEVWRVLEDVKGAMNQLTRDLIDLPAKIGHDLDLRTQERLAVVRAEYKAADDAVKAEITATMTAKIVVLETTVGRQQDKIDDLRRVVYGAVSIILVAVLTEIVALVVHSHG